MLHWSIEIKISCRQKGKRCWNMSRRALELVTRIGRCCSKTAARFSVSSRRCSWWQRRMASRDFRCMCWQTGCLSRCRRRAGPSPRPVRETAAPLQEQPGREHLANQTLASLGAVCAAVLGASGTGGGGQQPLPRDCGAKVHGGGGLPEDRADRPSSPSPATPCRR